MMRNPLHIFLIFSLGLIYFKVSIFGYFVNDDYMAAYSAWLIDNDSVANINFHADSYTLLFYLMSAVQPVIQSFQIHPIIIYRIVQIPFLVLLFILIYQFLTHFFDEKTCFSTTVLLFLTDAFTSRIIDLRPDLYILIISLYVINKINKDKNSLSYIGLFTLSFLLSISFLFKFKSLIFAPVFLYLVCLNRMWFVFYPKSLICLSLGLITPVGLFTWFYGFDELVRFFSTNFGLVVGITHHLAIPNEIKNAVLLKTIISNIVFFMLVLFGISCLWKKKETFKRNEMVVYLLTSVFFFYINPNFYYYNAYTILTVLTPLVALAIHQINPKLTSTLVFIIAVSHFFISPKISNSHQLELQYFINHTTKKDERVFAFEGIGLNRYSTYYWRSSGIMMADYQHGEFTIREQLKKFIPVLIINNYRIENWFNSQDTDYIKDNYVPLSYNVLTLGQKFTYNRDFIPSKSGLYTIENMNYCLINQQALHTSQIFLKANEHYNVSVLDKHCIIRWMFHQKEIDRLIEQNPNHLPYLFAP
jgi:hypothetical protein